MAHKHGSRSESERQQCIPQIQEACGILDHYHFHHSYTGPRTTERSGMTAFIAHEVDILVISDPLVRAKLRRVFAEGGVLDFPEPPLKHGDETPEAHVPPVDAKRERWC